jgi:MFS family permease
VLVAARAAQGLGAAILAPAVLAVLTTTFTEARTRARALSIWTSVGAVGGVLGSVVGGAITAALSWRWIFLINVPIGAGLIAVATVALVGRHERGTDGLDIGGAVSATVGMAVLIYGIVQTGSYGWASSRVLVPTMTGLALIALFVLIEGRLAARPMLPLRLLRSSDISGGIVLLILVGTISIAIWYFASLFFQNVLGYSPIRAGLALTPAAAALVVTARCVSVLLPRTGPRPLVAAGCLCHIIGFGWFAQASAASTYTADLLGPTMLAAVGIGLIFTPTTVAVTSRVTQSDAGIVSGLANASRQLGGSVGLAALATAASTRTGTLLGAHHHDGQVAALASGYDRVFLIAAGVAVAAALISPVLPRKGGMRLPSLAPGPASR